MIKRGKYLLVYLTIIMVWIIFTERISLEVIIIGLIIGAFIIKINNKSIESIVNKSYFRFNSLIYMIEYFLLLLKEIIIANFQVAMLVLNPNIQVSPRIISFHTKLKDPLLKTILANSITLTPGTLTIEVDKEKFTIHCLTERYIEGVINSKFETILLKIEE